MFLLEKARDIRPYDCQVARLEPSDEIQKYALSKEEDSSNGNDPMIVLVRRRDVSADATEHVVDLAEHIHGDVAYMPAYDHQTRC